MTALAQFAGKIWLWPLSIIAMFVMVPLLARQLYPDLPERLNTCTMFAFDYLLSPPVFPLTVAACLWLLICLQIRPGWKVMLIGLVVAVMLAESGREIRQGIESLLAR